MTWPAEVRSSAVTATEPASRRTTTAPRVKSSTPQSRHDLACPPIRSLSVGARHRDSRGGDARSSWTSRPSASTSTCAGNRLERGLRELGHSGRDRQLGPADLETRRGPRLVRRRPEAQRRPTSSRPSGARSGVQPGSVNCGALARSRGRAVGSSPSEPTRRRPANSTRPQPAEVAEVLPVVERDLLRAGSLFGGRDTRTGADRARCSRSAGLGVRSGQTRPSRQKLPSFGSSPKSPP